MDLKDELSSRMLLLREDEICGNINAVTISVINDPIMNRMKTFHNSGWSIHSYITCIIYDDYVH